MRFLLQRVLKAFVRVGDEHVAAIGPGLVVLVGIKDDDNDNDARYLVDKTFNLRIFPDSSGRFNLSAVDVQAELLIVSQFTLYAGTRRGRRPDFMRAAPPNVAWPLFEQVVKLAEMGPLKVVTGRFQENMVVEIHNDGPVSIWIDSEERQHPRRAHL